MKIINKLEKHNLIIESINDDIDSLINENIFTDLLSLGVGGVPGIIRKKVIEKLFDDSEKEKDKLEKEKKELEKEKKEDLEEKEKEELEKEIKKLSKEIDELKEKIKGYSEIEDEIEDEELPFNNITIKFKNKTSIDIEKLKSPEYKRNLIGTMYFKVVDFDESNKTMLLKTNSFPNTLTLRLTYNKLEDNIDLSGSVQLLYNKYGNFSINDIEGEEKDIYFKILKTK